MLVKKQRIIDSGYMSNPEQSNSQKFLQTFANPDGRLLIDSTETLSTEVTVEDVKVWVGAEFNASNDPYVSVVFIESDPEDGKERRTAASIELPAVFWLNDKQDGFDLPLPEVDTVQVEINDEAGLRTYNVPDSPDDPVTVEFWIPAVGYKDDITGKYAYPTILNEGDKALMRRLVSDVLSASVELVNTTQVNA